MLEHLQKNGKPSRVVILGAAGFVGQALATRLSKDGVDVLELTRKQVDLLNDNATESLQKLLKLTDTLVFVSAEAPCKNAAMLYRNTLMAHHVCEALNKQPVKHLVYISSDAVYADSDNPLTENSVTAPTALHGVMHLTREMMLQSVAAAAGFPMAVLRPSLLYGAKDPHNGYGPNQFRRLANAGKDIVLFGEGEERRDHVYIDDVAEIIARVVQSTSRGVLNIATGHVASFKEIANKVVKLANSKSALQPSPRKGPMPHNGYRPFDNAQCKKAFPDFTYTSLDMGLKISQVETEKKMEAA